MNDYKDQHTPCVLLLTDIWNFKSCPDGFAGWKARKPAIAKDVIPTIYELISADAADDEILRIVSSGKN